MKACYVHVPFCKDICAYCDFTRCRYHKGLADKWLKRITEEISQKLKNSSLETLYIGGGTPTALSYHQLQMLLESLAPYRKEVKEYTIEANIESLDADRIRLLRAHGVNRISLGVQSLQPILLEYIHRHHRKNDVIKCLDLLHENGMDNISIDLIYGLPKQTFAMWQQDLKEIAEHFSITHISLYALTIEEHSQFGRDGVRNIDSDIEADMYAYAIETLEKNGFYQYEISNFSKKGFESKHNQMYWKYEDFCGIGCGASGKENHVRYDNTKNLHTYITEGSSANITVLSKEDEMFEMLMMSLRMKKGVSLSAFYNRFHENLEEYYKNAMQKNIEKNLLVIEGDYLRTTKQGMLLLHDVLVDFLPE